MEKLYYKGWRMQTLIADALEVIRIGFWASFWSLFGSCLIALIIASTEQLIQRSMDVPRSVYSGPSARTGTILMLVGIAAIASMWTAVTMLGGLPRADTIGEQITKAVTGTDAAHIALLVGSVISVLMFSCGAIFYLYSERVYSSHLVAAPASSEPATVA